MSVVQKSLTTSKGTELPLLNLKGKPYLQVAHRLVWFVEENSNYRINTEYIKVVDDESVIRTTITLANEAGQVVRSASATKRETKEGFSDHLEKAETGSLGRALAMLGYGTQFAPELDEANRLADAPIDIAKKVPVVAAALVVVPSAPVVADTTVVAVVAKPSFRPKKVESKNGDLF